MRQDDMTVGKIEFGPDNNQGFQPPEGFTPPDLPPIPVKVYSESKHNLPEYETSGASGMDLRANESVKIFPNETLTVGTGIYVELPPMLEFQIRPRSGLSLKTKLRVANSPGTIDCVPIDAQILSPSGHYVSMRDIVDGDIMSVTSVDEETLETFSDVVEHAWLVGDRETVILSFDDKSSIEVTTTQLVMTKAGWKQAGSLTVDDEVISI
jgi:hypothetical protein